MNDTASNNITIEEFRTMIDNLVGDATDPNSEIHQLIAEGRGYVAQTAKFDVEFARKIGLVVSSIEDLLQYVKNRKEQA